MIEPGLQTALPIYSLQSAMMLRRDHEPSFYVILRHSFRRHNRRKSRSAAGLLVRGPRHHAVNILPIAHRAR
jgi:hypothetical protein